MLGDDAAPEMDFAFELASAFAFALELELALEPELELLFTRVLLVLLSPESPIPAPISAALPTLTALRIMSDTNPEIPVQIVSLPLPGIGFPSCPLISVYAYDLKNPSSYSTLKCSRVILPEQLMQKTIGKMK